MNENIAFHTNTTQSAPITGQLAVKRQHDAADQRSKMKQQKRKKKHLSEEDPDVETDQIEGSIDVLDDGDDENRKPEFDLLA